MALEPLGSIMTIQSQTAQKTAETKPVVENTDVPTSEQGVYIDPVTVTVAAPENEAGQGSGMNQADQQQANNEKIRKAVEQLNKSMPNSEAVFGIHEATNRVTIKIIDKTSKEVIREFPPEKTLDMIAKVWEMAGILVDEKR